MTYTVLVCWS